MIRSASFALLILAATPVLAQQAAPAGDAAPAPDADIENIVVTGRRSEGWTIKDLMLDFVGEIGDPAAGSGYARWQDRVCVSVYSLRNAQTAQFVVDRVSAVALDVGLRPGEPGCSPNLHIIFTSDGAALADNLVRSNRSAFRPYGGAGGTTQGLQALAEFATSDAAVRWWQVTMPVDRMGNIAVNTPQFGIPTISSPGSRITNSVSSLLLATYVIVDATKTGNVHWDALADYLAMVSLAQVDPGGVPSNYNSILNLFKTTNAAARLTELDRSYLRALYRMDTRRMPGMQRGLLASTMVLEQDRMEETEAEAE